MRLEQLMTESLVRRLASACAHGWRQQALVNEMLVRPVTRRQFPVPGSGLVSSVYGDAQLQSSSFINLRRRLATVGFVFTTTKLSYQESLITMSFPEQENKKS